MYTAIVLKPESHNRLLAHFQGAIPPTWEKLAHHMTINMGNISAGPLNDDYLNQEIELTVVSLAYDNKVIAAGVNTKIPSANAVKHITLAVDRSAGGKPFHSNQLTNWTPTTPIALQGIIQEVG